MGMTTISYELVEKKICKYLSQHEGKWLPSYRIAKAIGNLQNTTVKGMHFIRKRGNFFIMARREKGKNTTEYIAYQLIDEAKRISDLIDTASKLLIDYPESAKVEREKIMCQIKQLEQRIAKLDKKK